MTEPTVAEPDHPELLAFWELARFHAKLNAAPSYFGPTTLEALTPPAWTFGDAAADADTFAQGVLAREGGETTAPRTDYDDALPETGVLSILCDGSGRPVALLETTGVDAVDDDVVERFRVVYRA
jgi:uncharacterized protein YhfF